jgi:hypothetical protein
MTKEELWKRFNKHGITKKFLLETGKYRKTSIYIWGRNDHVPKPVLKFLNDLETMPIQEALQKIPSHDKMRDRQTGRQNINIKRALEIYNYVSVTRSISETKRAFGYKNENSVRQVLNVLAKRGYPYPNLRYKGSSRKYPRCPNCDKFHAPDRCRIPDDLLWMLI